MYEFAKDDIYDDESSNYSLNKELDYSISEASHIDSRILQVCKNAESNFLENQKAVKEVKKMRDNDHKLHFSKIKENKSNKREILKQIDSDDKHNLELNDNIFRKNIINYPVVIDKEKLQNQDREINSFNYKEILSKNEYRSNLKEEENNKADIIDKNNQRNSFIDRNSSLDKDVKYKSALKLQKTVKSTFQENIPENNKRLSLTHKHVINGKKCTACELKKR
jgi:hypothetical protein